jgi:hypothetical protein
MISQAGKPVVPAVGRSVLGFKDLSTDKMNEHEI